MSVHYAKPFAVASDRFADRSLDGLPPVAFYHRVGKGVTVLLASIDPPAASGVRRLYSRILDQAVTATDVWPKVECSDRVRYSVYPDGTIYVLNTENSLRSEVIVRRWRTRRRREFCSRRVNSNICRSV